jgi:transcription initiation factor IIE alpha subunit
MRLINNNYICPNCKGHLRVGNYLVFATKTENKHKGMILMSPVVGNYEYEHHEKFILNEGEKVNFYCPICHSDLTSAVNSDYAMVHMVCEEDGAEYELYFSKLKGNKSTYLVANDTVESFGVEDLDFEYFAEV